MGNIKITSSHKKKLAGSEVKLERQGNPSLEGKE